MTEVVHSTVSGSIFLNFIPANLTLGEHCDASRPYDLESRRFLRHESPFLRYSRENLDTFFGQALTLAERAVKVERGANLCEMCECLGEISERLSLRARLFGV